MDLVIGARRWQSVRAVLAGRPRPDRLGIVMVLGALVVGGAPGAGAQAGTPAAGPDVVTAAQCTVEPRPERELRALFRNVAASPLPDSLDAGPTPAAAPTGPPADEQTVADVNATWRQYLACLIAGDQARMFALLSDTMVRRQLVVDIAFGVTEEALFASPAATPVPVGPDQALPFVPLTDVRVLGDGRVAAVGSGDAGRREIRIFVDTGDRWLLDDWYELP